MKFRCLSIFLTVGALVQPGAGHAIVWGVPDGTDHPNVGALFARFDPDVFSLPDPGIPEGIYPVCSGSLIAVDDDRGLFLTAGHCVQAIQGVMEGAAALDPDPVVSFASNLHEGLGSTFLVDMASAYFMVDALPSASGANASYRDIGALVLVAEDGAEFPEPVALPWPGMLDALHPADFRRSELHTLGYGDDFSGRPPHGRARVFGIREIAFPSALNLNGHYLMVNQVGPAGNSGVYFGDSGGPTFYVDPASLQETQVAISIGWVGANVHGNPVLTVSQHFRIDTEESLGFLLNVLLLEGF